ncbi:GntR family transcriptional regulator [Actinomadura rubrobrunea]|uniref:GntR family transcriptional regulator n=1 Tax=Actinomadura rubrobrunea TaxID=115335 RepID=A0A9W6UUG6_9ACTN|nr:GntR family transcriptional regulator [Actinomadura rubrobrunea]GLW63889.1 GntR family transcriptional regulator [Actinomadura rubrobrunea]
MQPAYLRIADDLRRQIVDGRLAPGDKIPGRRELAELHGVSDKIAMRAVQVLIAEGYVESRSGSGTYVRERPRVQRLTRSWYREARGRGRSPFRADMESQGSTGTWRSNSRTDAASPAVAERLGIGEGDPVMCTHYIFLADDVPVMLSTSWEPLELTGGTPVMLPEDGPYAGAGVVARMRAIGHEIGMASEIITARSITAAEAAELDEPLGSIVMVIQRTYSTAERPVETADIIVPTDRYELAYMIPVE